MAGLQFEGLGHSTEVKAEGDDVPVTIVFRLPDGRTHSHQVELHMIASLTYQSLQWHIPLIS